MVKEIKKGDQIRPDIEVQAEVLGLLLEEIENQGQQIAKPQPPATRPQTSASRKIKSG